MEEAADGHETVDAVPRALREHCNRAAELSAVRRHKTLRDEAECFARDARHVAPHALPPWRVLVPLPRLIQLLRLSRFRAFAARGWSRSRSRFQPVEGNEVAFGKKRRCKVRRLSH